MAEGASIKVHMLKMIATFEEAEVLRATIGRKSQVGMVLETLSNSFSQFKLNYNMKKLEMTLTKSMQELQIEEKVMRPHVKALAIKSSSLRIGHQPRKFKKKKRNAMG
jgi:hypothetical protein